MTKIEEFYNSNVSFRNWNNLLEQDRRRIIDNELNNSVKLQGKRLMGTLSFHLMINNSETEYDWFVASHESKDFWIGCWLTGLGLINALFPKETSREFTEEEQKRYDDAVFVII